MSEKSHKPITAAKGERRSGIERRRADSKTPVSVERRRSIEPRKPDVVEIEMSPTEWEALQRQFNDAG